MSAFLNEVRVEGWPDVFSATSRSAAYTSFDRQKKISNTWHTCSRSSGSWCTRHLKYGRNQSLMHHLLLTEILPHNNALFRILWFTEVCVIIWYYIWNLLTVNIFVMDTKVNIIKIEKYAFSCAFYNRQGLGSNTLFLVSTLAKVLKRNSIRKNL